MNFYIQYLISSGIPENLVMMVLLVPVMTTVIVLVRQVIGLTTYGLSIPLIVTICLSIAGLNFGIAAFLFALIIAIITRVLLKRTRLLYMPKMGITTIILMITMVVFLHISITSKLYSPVFLGNALLPMLILAILTEKFLSVQSEQSFWTSMKITLQTLLTAIIAAILVGVKIDLGFTILQFPYLLDLIKRFPEIIIVFLLLNIILGKWTGLRLVEYIRFREILRHSKEEEEE